MFAYYLDLALRSLKRSPILTALMITAVGMGVAAAMTTYAVFRAVSGDPIPWKSSHLYFPQIDMWGPQNGAVRKEPPDALDYLDAESLLRDHRAKRQAALYPIAPSLVPDNPEKHPQTVLGYAVNSEFFALTEAPFLYGAAWRAQDDEQRMTAVVISGDLNQKIFGGANSVGRTINLNGRDFRIGGVLNRWNPQPRFYDIHSSGGFTIDANDVFIPFKTAIAMKVSHAGNVNCSKTLDDVSFNGILNSTCAWISYMVELGDVSSVDAYRNYLDGYARKQQSAGRFGWEPNNRLRDLPQWLDFEEVVPSDTKVSMLVAAGLLIVCLVNTTGLLLAKFLSRQSEVGLRRALGATKKEICAQFLIEAGIVGTVGGILGLLLTWIGVLCLRRLLSADIAPLAHLDFSLLMLCMTVAVIATTLSGLYPALRASKIQPAMQLKPN